MQDLAEKLFARVHKSGSERFEMRLGMMQACPLSAVLMHHLVWSAPVCHLPACSAELVPTEMRQQAPMISSCSRCYITGPSPSPERVCGVQVLSRMIGCHQLMLLNFYPFLQKYIQPHQTEVPTILAVLVQVRVTGIGMLGA